ncbi:Fibropellin-1 [Holothuria leucospilota]|uniref:Fibropellin-1 n=1 Tax=Holothuria leucospilota TaxID=206669 RepID=A0A9Q1BJG1_HOLLE|nr:Fibropellin-1 [Holothuria leucospilota]
MTCQRFGNPPTGDWDVERPSCEQIHCPVLLPPENGRLSQESCCTIYGSWCSFVCDSGFNLIGSSSRHCLSREGDPVGYWDGEEVMCEAFPCPSPYIPLHGMFTNDSSSECSRQNNVPKGTVCNYECEHGYFRVGSASLSCVENGRWSDHFPDCQVITCDIAAIVTPTNGYRIGCSTDTIPYNSTCTLGCYPGYMPTTPSTVKCVVDINAQNAGKWQGDIITECFPVTCIPYDPPDNGYIKECQHQGRKINATRAQPFRATCTADCDDGYTPVGAISRSCLQSGMWEENTLECKDVAAPNVVCPDPILLVAEPGRQFVATDFPWEPLQVSDVSQPVSVMLSAINDINEGYNRTTVFSEGVHFLRYVITDGAGNEAKCTVELTIRVTRCPPLLPPIKGEAALVGGQGSCNNNPVLGSVCIISCKEGYELSGHTDTNERECVSGGSSLVLGHWDGDVRDCQAVTCKVPNVTNGYVYGCSGDSVIYQTKCFFSCNVGFQGVNRINVVDRRCKADGTWTGSQMNCSPIECQGGFQLQHGSISPEKCSQEILLPYSATCQFTCDDGFRLDGPSVKICTLMGTWNSGRKAVCIDEEPPKFNTSCPSYIHLFAESGITKAILRYNEPAATDNAGADEVNITRSSPFDMGEYIGEGSQMITYTAIDEAGNQAKCNFHIIVRVHRCPVLQTPARGSINCPKQIFGAACQFSCNEGYDLQGLENLTCILQGSTPAWNGITPTCQPVMCPALSHRPPPAFRTGCNGLSEPYGTKCVWSCPYGYQGTGVSESICQADGSWTGGDFTCTERECPDIHPPEDVTFTPPGCNINPSFEDICYLSCKNTGYKIHPLTVEPLRCGGDGKWSRDTTNITCRDNQAPSFLDCPMDFLVYTEKGLLQTHVSWNISAEDNSNEHINVICDRDVMVYPLGEYPTKCTATDLAGNAATCKFTFTVKARKCQQLSPPMYGEFVGPCSNHYGSTCTIQCVEGYRLKGSNQASCERDETTEEMFWAKETTPECKVSSCPPIPESIVPTSGGISPAHCTGGTNPVFGVLCTFYCDHSFNLTGNINQIRCESDGSWNIDLDTISVVCNDEVNPTIIVCPENQFLTLSDGNTEVEAYFDVPAASDNSRNPLVVEKTPADVRSPYTVNETTIVTYEFFDQSNNSARCSFIILVQSNLFPEVENCPDNITTPATGRLTSVTWLPPDFSEPTGKDNLLSVSCNFDSGTEFPWGKQNIVCTATNRDNGKTAECKFKVEVVPAECPKLPAPRNGALACDDWAYGHFCNQQCNEKYDVPPGNYNPFFICGSSGIWTPSKVLDCSFRRRPGSFQLSSQIQYYSGSCSDPETKKAIQEAFIKLISNHTLNSDVCEGRQECRAENVVVTCGAGRSKRFFADENHYLKKTENLNLNDFLLYKKAEDSMKASKKGNYVFRKYEERAIKKAKKNARKLRQKRNDQQGSVMTISFQIVANIPDGITDEEYDDTAYNTVDTLYNVVDVLEKEAEDGVLVPEVENMSLSVNQDQPLSYDYPGPNCKAGFVISWESLTCVPCVAGTYLDSVKAQCILCPIGTYQDNDTQTECLQCPSGTTTLQEGSTNSSECFPLCTAGKYSNNGVEPCSLCEVGKYQPRSGTTGCVSCPSYHSTLKMGSTSEDQCLAFCSPGYYSSTGFKPCQPCPVRYYQSKAGQQSCNVCPGIKTTVGVGTVNKTQCNVTAECTTNDCVNGATCLPLIQGPMCLCADGFNGTYCEGNIIDCFEHACLNGGKCIDGVNSYSCLCQPGFEGSDCSIDIDECALKPCVNDSVCIDLKGDFLCECLEGYTGKRCQDEINPCDSNPCQNGGTCQNRRTSFHCLCPSGTTGEICEIDINECQSRPCLNNGICSNLRDSYECACTPGYSGDLCETDEDLCKTNPCLNEGTCMDETDIFVCVCPPGKAGDICERDATPCDKKPCLNGQCKPSSQIVDGKEFNYTCDCSLTGFTGIYCQVEINECLSNPCSNGGNCTDMVNAFVCECPNSFTGDTCDKTVNPCDETICENNGTCTADGSSASCICPVGFEGTHCDTTWSNCQDEFCQNGGYCASSGGSEFCTCLKGFNGIACERNINECKSEPCENGGVCIDAVGNYTCDCQPGYSGENCEVNIDECLSGPCLNGTCIDQINGFVCQCYDGFEGTLCNFNTNDCAEHKCVNGRCNDGNDTYTCDCHSGFGGRFCETKIDECSSNPCAHSTECKDLLDGYMCVCKNGWIGHQCETSIDDCVECDNGGTCQDKHMDFTCLCPPGFEGKLCEKNINECASSPCLEGSCIDEVNGYKCTCPKGREGKQCQIHTSVCLPNPCSNGGTCSLDKDEEGYSCFCIDGFVGDHCKTNVDDCKNHDCPESASCVDKINGYSCICPSGFEGENCDEAMDPCIAFPCRNGGTCVVGEDSKSSCQCPLGYEGIYCDQRKNYCEPDPCLNNGVCKNGMNESTCQCATGYRGETCDEDIDFCENDLCDYPGTKKCHDGIEGYTCECRHGFLGQYCDEASSVNYDMVFSSFDENQFVVIRRFPQEDVESFTLVLWLRTTSEDSIILMHVVESDGQPDLASIILEYPKRLTAIVQQII